MENLILGDEGATWGTLGAGVGPFCFLLISKHNIDSGAKGQRHPVGGPAVGRVVRRWEEGLRRNSLFTPLDFPSKIRQASHWNPAAGPSAPPILKIGDLFLPPGRGGTITLVLRDPGASGSPCSSPEPLFPRRAQNLRTGPRPWSFLTVHRGLLANLIRGEKIQQS